eukprot:360308-Chlamydomonas_euryale.AAC.1
MFECTGPGRALNGLPVLDDKPSVRRHDQGPISQAVPLAAAATAATTQMQIRGRTQERAFARTAARDSRPAGVPEPPAFGSGHPGLRCW